MDILEKLIQKPRTNKKAQEEKVKYGKNVFRDMFIKEKKKAIALSKELEALRKETTKNKKSGYDKLLIERNRKMNEKLNELNLKNEILQTKVQKLQQQCKNSEFQYKQHEEQLQSQVTKLSADATSFKEATTQLHKKLKEAYKVIFGGAEKASFISRLEEKAKDIEKRENEVKNKEEIVNTQMEKIREYPNMQMLIASLRTELLEAEVLAEAKSALEEEKSILLLELNEAEIRESELLVSGENKESLDYFLNLFELMWPDIKQERGKEYQIAVRNKLQNMLSEERRLKIALGKAESGWKTAEVKNRSLVEQIRELNLKLENQAVLEKEQDDHVKRLQTELFKLERERDRIGRILEAYEEALLKVSEGNTSDYVQRFLAELRAKEDSIATYHTKVEELEQKLQKIADLENTIEEASKSRTEMENAYSAIFGYSIHRVQGNLFKLINNNARSPNASFNFKLKEDGQVTFSHSTLMQRVLDENIWKCCSLAVFLAIFNESYLRDPDQQLL